MGREMILLCMLIQQTIVFILTQRQLSVALQQWLDVILNYNLKIKYRPGIQHIIPDALSRLYGQAYVNDEVWD